MQPSLDHLDSNVHRRLQEQVELQLAAQLMGVEEVECTEIELEDVYADSE